MTLEALESRFKFASPPESLGIVEVFHRERRMFCLREGRIELAPEGYNGSHAKWFLEMGWISEEDDSFLVEGLGGMVYRGRLYFYSGWDFRVDEMLEQTFLTTLVS